MKIEIGKQYKVHGTEEDGNVIKITEKKNGLCRYETISGKKPFVDQFECDSLFARLLTPCNEETKIVILRKGNTVTATQYVNTEKVHTGVATCSQTTPLILPLMQSWLWNGCWKNRLTGRSLLPERYGFRSTAPT